jgi:hypothetical protein
MVPDGIPNSYTNKSKPMKNTQHLVNQAVGLAKDGPARIGVEIFFLTAVQVFQDDDSGDYNDPDLFAELIHCLLMEGFTDMSYERLESITPPNLPYKAIVSLMTLVMQFIVEFESAYLSDQKTTS